jgi:hypothetical protein
MLFKEETLGGEAYLEQLGHWGHVLGGCMTT